MVYRDRVIDSPDAPPTPPYLSQAVRAGDLVYVSGNAAFASRAAVERGETDVAAGEFRGGDVAEQTKITLENIMLTVEAAGGTPDDIVKVNAWLSDVDRDFWDYTAAYVEFFPGDRPARTTVGARIYGGILVEIECVVYLPQR